MFVGRERERARIGRLLDDARAGRSGALLLHGEVGIGKTALLRWAVAEAGELRVVRARGIETESDIPFAGLGELVTPLLDRLDAVPEVQAAARRGSARCATAPRSRGSTSPGWSGCASRRCARRRRASCSAASGWRRRSPTGW